MGGKFVEGGGGENDCLVSIRKLSVRQGSE